LVGTHPDPEQLAEQVRQARRRGDVSQMVNVSVKDRTSEVIINADAGRARRPLLVVENGEPLMSDEQVELSKRVNWSSKSSSNAVLSSSSTPRRKRTSSSASTRANSPRTTPTSKSTRS
jgi:DNA-directed RNA polymerase, beta subunit/140 kD subunit